jgi:hypothetical protein
MSALKWRSAVILLKGNMLEEQDKRFWQKLGSAAELPAGLQPGLQFSLAPSDTWLRSGQIRTDPSPRLWDGDDIGI